MDEDGYFEGHGNARAIHRAIARVVRQIGASDTQVSRSQIGFYRKHPFAATWMPRRYLKGETAPLVLTVFLRHHDDSIRWKEVVEPTPGRFTHHMELYSPDEVDDLVKAVLARAWREAG